MASKPRKKQHLSPELEVLARNLLARPSAEPPDLEVLRSQLRPIPPAEKEAFFADLFEHGGDPILSFCEALGGKEESLDMAMARALGDWNSPKAGEFLGRWAGREPEKSLAKEIRRSMFRLRSKGISIAEEEDKTPGVFRLPQPSSASAEGYLSGIDGRGSRLIWIVRPQLGQGVMAINSLISDAEGIIDFRIYESTRRKFHESLEQMRKDFSWEFVEADPDYCAGLIHQAHEIQKGKNPNPEYVKFQNLVGPKGPRPLLSPIYREVSEEEIKAHLELMDRSPSLFQTPFFAAWFLEKEEAHKYLDLLEDASRSRLILAPHQQESRLFEIYQQAVHELFDENRRLLFRRRLEEMAFILWKKDLQPEARIALSAAAGLSEESKILYPHPFLLELVKRTLMYLLEEKKQEKEKEKGSGLIIPP